MLEQIPVEEQEQEFTLGQDGTSLFDDLRADNQKMRAAKTAEFDIPGYEREDLGGRSALVARYHRASLEEHTVRLRAVSEAAAAERFDEVFALYADFLIDNCDGVLKRLAGGDLLDLGVKYDLPLADGLRFEAKSCRDVVRGVFGDNEIAVGEHANEVFDWMRTGKTKDDQEHLGNS